MSIATIDVQPRARNVEFNDKMLTVLIEDGRAVSVPIEWYPRLLNGTTEEKTVWRVFQDSDGRDIIFWETLDELMPVVALLTGTPSRESNRSLERWRLERESKRK